MRQSSLFWDRAVSCGLDQSHVNQRSHILDREVSYGSDQSHVGQTSLMWDRAVSCGSDETEHRVSKTELLDIRKHIWDTLDGIIVEGSGLM